MGLVYTYRKWCFNIDNINDKWLAILQGVLHNYAQWTRIDFATKLVQYNLIISKAPRQTDIFESRFDNHLGGFNLMVHIIEHQQMYILRSNINLGITYITPLYIMTWSTIYPPLYGVILLLSDSIMHQQSHF
jgi:hypothetical protein